jgi:small subunit ribosomal protein S21
LDKTLYLQPKLKINTKNIMLIVAVKEGESIEKALKKFKKKFEKTGVVKQLRVRKNFEKPSITNRQTRIKAVYKQKMQLGLAE